MTTTQAAKFLNLQGSLMDFSTPRVMGIVNLTADSFYDGGKIKSDTDLLTKVEQMMVEGVDILDVGAYSSRPGASDIPLEIEMETAENGVKTILKEFPKAVISIDSFRSEVAKKSLEAGAQVINDISGGQLDEQMFDLLEKVNVPYIMMHMRGTPQTMSGLTEYDDLTTDVIDYFLTRIKNLTERGVKDIVIDPGFGFAKTKEQNFELLNKLGLLGMLDTPMLCGVSRKSMIFKTLGGQPDDALNGTTALNMVCLMKGANILRVHDVKEAKETISLYQSMINS
ncbi:dihydropteroate synthase [Reichenbachiella versicolor]|uniref:dihydropteroate synthase n=1 Tax=Reichenbachiella versicolor TaxID=1821036 RepID=UPI001FE2F84A|nr:dihydropteroate synthase [Reichenbachiella versicolor]